MKKLFPIIAVVLLPAAAFATGNTTSKNMGIEYRTHKFCIANYQAVADADVVAGISGVGVIASGQAATLPYSHYTQTSSIAPFPYPSKVLYNFVDGGAASGPLSCTTLQIWGLNQFGDAQTETFSGTSSVTETAKESVNVYSVLTKVAASTCYQGHYSDTSDKLRVRAGTEVGLPLRINGAGAAVNYSVQKICVTDASASSVPYCMKPAAADAATSFDAQPSSSRIDAIHHSVELSGNIIANGAALADGDTICITEVAPGGFK